MIRPPNMLFALLAAVFLSACASGAPPDDPPAPSSCPTPRPSLPRSMTLAVLGDLTGHPDDDVFFGILRKIHKLSPDAIVSVGDLIEGYQPEARLDEANAEWEAVLGRMKSIIFDTPFYSAAGNHDVWSDASASLFEEKLGHPINTTLSFGNSFIIIFDTSRYASEREIPSASLDWLYASLLSARDKTARVVITHRPLWAQKLGGRYGSPLHDVLIAGDATMVICGHWHHTMSDDRDGIQYRMIGSSGASPNQPGHPESGNFHQFGLLVATVDGVSLTLLDEAGVLPGDHFPYEVNQFEWRILNRTIEVKGFDIDDRRPEKTGAFSLLVNNATESYLDTTLSFEKSPWRISPQRSAISLPPGKSVRLRFAFERPPETALFPGPLAEMELPWPWGGDYALTKPLDPTLTHAAPRVGAAPRVDGDLSDPVWRRSVAIDRFFGGDELPGAASLTAVVFDEILYLGARIEDPDMAGQRISGEPRDGFLEEEDHLVFWLDGNPSEKGYVRIAVNAAGVVSDRLKSSGLTDAEEMAWDEARAAAILRDTGWAVELAIPLDKANWDGRGRIRFNAARGRWRSGLTRAFWQPLGDHDNDSFGALLTRGMTAAPPPTRPNQTTPR